MKIIFILSLPRSGSTLLQKVLLTLDDVSCPAEPWVLISPLCDRSEKYKVFAEYNSVSHKNAVSDFVSYIGSENYEKSLAEFYRRTVSFACDAEKNIFVDKTPRYHVFSEDLYKLFPDAKFIVLRRHPLAIVASLCKSWRKGNFDFEDYKFDLQLGLKSLGGFVDNYSCESNVLTLDYEKMVRPEFDWTVVSEFVGSKFLLENEINLAGISLNGRMGDKVGSKKYKNISTDSLSDWQKFYSNAFRVSWAKRYLKKIESFKGLPHCEFEPNQYSINLSIIRDVYFYTKGKLLKHSKIGVITKGMGSVLR